MCLFLSNLLSSHCTAKMISSRETPNHWFFFQNNRPTSQASSTKVKPPHIAFMLTTASFSWPCCMALCNWLLKNHAVTKKTCFENNSDIVNTLGFPSRFFSMKCWVCWLFSNMVLMIVPMKQNLCIRKSPNEVLLSLLAQSIGLPLNSCFNHSFVLVANRCSHALITICVLTILFFVTGCYWFHPKIKRILALVLDWMRLFWQSNALSICCLLVLLTFRWTLLLLFPFLNIITFVKAACVWWGADDKCPGIL